MLSSKKAIAALLATAAAIAGKLGFQLDTDAILVITSPLIAYIVGQGIADHGKGAAEVNATAPKPAEAVAVQVVP